MSGGSMDYLYTAGWGDIHKLVSEDKGGPGNLQLCVEIAKQAEAAHGVSCARFDAEVSEVLEMVDKLKAFATRWQGVLHDCEWKESGDYGLDQVAEGLKKVQEADRLGE